MAVTNKLYAQMLKSVFNAEIDLDSHTIKCMLCTSSYTPNQGTHRYKSDVTNEVVGTGYTAGGVALASVTVNVTGNTFTFDAGDTSWPSSTLTGRYLVYYDDNGGTDAAKALIGYVDFGADVSTTSGTFQSVWNSSGIFAGTVA